MGDGGEHAWLTQGLTQNLSRRCLRRQRIIATLLPAQFARDLAKFNSIKSAQRRDQQVVCNVGSERLWSSYDTKCAQQRRNSAVLGQGQVFLRDSRWNTGVHECPLNSRNCCTRSDNDRDVTPGVLTRCTEAADPVGNVRGLRGFVGEENNIHDTVGCSLAAVNVAQRPVQIAEAAIRDVVHDECGR